MIPSIPSSSSSPSARIRIPHSNNSNANKNIPIGVVVEERPNPHRSQLPSHHHHHHQQRQQHTRATRTTYRLCSTTRVVRIILVLIVIYFMIVIVWKLYIHQYSLSTGISSSIFSSLLLIQQHNDYELEKLESYGFFTDIDSATWHRHQQHAHSAIYDETISYNRSYPNDQADTNPAAWLMTNVQPFFTCPNLRRLGGHGDGAKWTCDPHRFVLQQESDDCLIYSVWSSGSYVFEDTIVSYSRHQNNIDNKHGKDGTITSTTCEIHVFDPEPSYARINDAINNNIHYHAWALQSSQVHKVIDPNSNKKKKKKYKWQVEYKNLYEIIQLLGHEHRRIDVLKLDCEGCEWTTYMDWLFMTTTNHNSNNHNNYNISVDIRQILMQTHALPPIINGGGGPESFYNAMIQNHYV